MVVTLSHSRQVITVVRRLSDGLGWRTEPDEDGTGTLLGSSSVGDGRGGVWGADRDQHLASDQLHEGR